MNHQSNHHHHLTCYVDRQTNIQTHDRKNTSSHPSSQPKIQMVHTRMAHTLGHHKSSSQTDRHCHRHTQKPSSYSPEYSPYSDSPPTLSQKMHHSPPSLGCLKGSTSADQRGSLQASTQQNQSPK